MTRRPKRQVMRDCQHCKHPHYTINEPPYECSVYRLPTEPMPSYSVRRSGNEGEDAKLAAELSEAFRKRSRSVDVPATGGKPAADLYMPRRGRE